jgi:hypothetical protein
MLNGLQVGAAEIVVICLPAERDNRQPVRQLTLQPGRNYDGLQRTTCLLARVLPGATSPPIIRLAHTGGSG